MNSWLYSGVSIAAVGTIVYLLYCKGFGVTKSIVAVLFAFRPGKNSDKANLSSCNGWVRHVGRFQESRTYDFTFDAQLSKGDAEVILLDKKKQQLLILNRQVPYGKIEIDIICNGTLRVQPVSVSCIGKWVRGSG